MTAVGSNPAFAGPPASMWIRCVLLSVIMSTWLGAVGRCSHQQGFGFIQLYLAPKDNLDPCRPCPPSSSAALLNKASIPNVIIGTLLLRAW